MGRYFPFTCVYWPADTAARVRLCFSDTEACHKSKKKSFVCHICVFFLLTGASHEWGVSFESFSSSIHKHQFHYEPVRWALDREDEKDEMKEKRCSDAGVCVDTLSLSLSLCSIFCLPALWTGGCSRLQYPVRSHYSHCAGRKGENERWEDKKTDRWK